MSYPYDLDLFFGSEQTASDSVFLVNLSSNSSGQETETIYYHITFTSGLYTVSLTNCTDTSIDALEKQQTEFEKGSIPEISKITTSSGVYILSISVNGTVIEEHTLDEHIMESTETINIPSDQSSSIKVVVENTNDPFNGGFSDEDVGEGN